MNFEKLGRFRRAYRTLRDENHRGMSVKESRNITESSVCAIEYWLVVRRSSGILSRSDTMTAVAISNNDMVYLHWNVSGKIPDCLGFNIIRHDAISNDHEPLPAMVGFPSPEKSDGKKGAGQTFRNTSVWPVQKFAWKDLFAKRGGTYWYEAVPMVRTLENLNPDPSRTMRTNSVPLHSNQGDR